MDVDVDAMEELGKWNPPDAACWHSPLSSMRRCTGHRMSHASCLIPDASSLLSAGEAYCILYSLSVVEGKGRLHAKPQPFSSKPARLAMTSSARGWLDLPPSRDCMSNPSPPRRRVSPTICDAMRCDAQISRAADQCDSEPSILEGPPEGDSKSKRTSRGRCSNPLRSGAENRMGGLSEDRKMPEMPKCKNAAYMDERFSFGPRRSTDTPCSLYVAGLYVSDQMHSRQLRGISKNTLSHSNGGSRKQKAGN